MHNRREIVRSSAGLLFLSIFEKLGLGDSASFTLTAAARLQSEFAADLMLRFVGSGKGEKEASHQRVLVQVFAISERVLQPTALAAVPVGYSDTAAAMSGFANRVGIDRLSLDRKSVV